MKGLFPALAVLLLASAAGASVFDVLLVVPEKYGANLNFNADHFQGMGFRITTAGTSETISACNPSLPVIEVDTLIQDILDVSCFDAVVIMPSRWQGVAQPYNDLMESPEALALIQSAVADSIPLWSTCAGPLVLAAADVLQGVTIQGRTGPDSSFVEIYENAGANYIGWGLLPVIDGPIITTSRGQYLQRENCQAVVSAWAALNSSTAVEDPEETTSRGIRSIAALENGGFAAAGYAFSGIGHMSDVLVMKLDQSGLILWETTIGEEGFDQGLEIIQASDGHLIVTGYTTRNGNEDILLAKVDTQGNLIWERVWGTEELEIARSACEGPDGSLFVTGRTCHDAQGGSDVLLMKTDVQGNLLWERTYGGSGPETADRILLTEQDQLLIAGSTGSFTENSDAYQILLDLNGDLIREDYYGAQGGEGGYDRANSAIILPDGRIAMAGESNDPDKCGMYFVLTESDGEKILESFHGNIFYDYCSCLIATDDGGFLLAGATKDRYTCDNDAYLVKLNEYGELVWEMELGEESTDEWCFSLEAVAPGVYMAAGQKETAAGGFQEWIFQVEDPSMGSSPRQNGPCPVWPNPASSSITLMAADINSPVRVVDLTGRTMLTEMVVSEQVQIDVSNLPAGIYSVQWLSDSTVSQGRVVILR